MINKLKVYKIFCIYISLLLTNLEMYCAARMESENTASLDSALITAVTDCDKEQVKKLLKAGANSNSGPHLGTVLRTAVSKGNKDITKLLIESRADVNAAGFAGYTILMRAVDAGNTDITEFLIKSGADINAVGSHGKIALIYAIESGQRLTAKILLENGIDFNKKTNHNETAILLAIIKGDIDFVKMLLNFKVDINMITRFCQTANMRKRERKLKKPNRYFRRSDDFEDQFKESCEMRTETSFLIVAVRNRLVDMVQLLLKAGADLNIKDGLDKTAIDYANVEQNETYGEEDKKELMEIHKMLVNEPARRGGAIIKFKSDIHNIINEVSAKMPIRPLLLIIFQYIGLSIEDVKNMNTYEQIPLSYRLEL